MVGCCLVSESPRQQLGYIADGPQDRATDNFTCCHTRDRRVHEVCLSRSHYTDTDSIQLVVSGQSQRKSNPGPPHKESCALPTELPRLFPP